MTNPTDVGETIGSLEPAPDGLRLSDLIEIERPGLPVGLRGSFSEVREVVASDLLHLSQFDPETKADVEHTHLVGDVEGLSQSLADARRGRWHVGEGPPGEIVDALPGDFYVDQTSRVVYQLD